MPILRKILYAIAYLALIHFGGKGFRFITDTYPSTFVFIGVVIFALGTLILIGYSVLKEIRK